MKKTTTSPDPRHLAPIQCAAIVLLTIVASASHMHADPTPGIITFNTPEQFDRCFRDTHIDAVTTPGRITLAPTEMFISHLGNRIQWARAAPNSVARKTFHLDTVQATHAEIYFFRTPGEASINNHPLTVDRLPYGGWSRAIVKPQWLRSGLNTLRFESNFSLAMDLDAPHAPGNEISDDNGKTWRPADGAFLAHLRLWRHPPRGTITSPVIDLNNPHRRDVIHPDMRWTKVDISPTADVPEHTQIQLQARTGATPRPDAAWTDWAFSIVVPARFIQWRATLTTTDRTVTPRLESITIHAAGEPSPFQPAGLHQLREFANQHIVRSGYPYQYQTPSPNLEQLRKQFDLDHTVATGDTDLEKLVLLRNWVRRQWPNNDDGSRSRTWNAIEILGAPRGQHGMCVHYANAYSQCALALGYTARPIVLHHHFVADVWSDAHRKWVLMDVESVNSDVYKQYGTCLYIDADSRAPLSALDLHQAIVNKTTDKVVQQMYRFKDGEHQMVERPTPQPMSIFDFFAYVDRNNHIDQLEPWEEFHGFDHYHSDAYLWWADAAVPLRLEYSRHTNRPADINPSLNQAQLTVTTAPDPNTLNVLIQTFTPNFQTFLYRTNQGPWQTLDGRGAHPDDRHAQLTWTLKPDRNTLEVRPRDKFGHDGIISTITVVH